jgi:hypothetical protein
MNASTPSVISTARLTELCGLHETRLRQLAQEGWIPKPSRREHPLVATVGGLLRYYREWEQNRAVREVYESFGECSAAVGIPVKTLNRAKRKGCPALRHNRVRLKPFLEWWFATEYKMPDTSEADRAERTALKNAKLRMELRRLKRELMPADEVFRLGAELGMAIRKTVLRAHLLAPSLVDQPLEVVEKRLREEEQGIVDQLGIAEEQIRRWQAKVAD